ncbi:hypothetical protein KDL29_03750 [bacterium]|nr:hypothetical protein [bacterium]
MAVPKLDPRFTTDRVYGYGEYKILSAAFGERRPNGLKAWQRRLAKGKAVRLFGFKLAIILGIVAAVIGLAAMAAFDSETMQLSYEDQQLSQTLGTRIEQQMEEAQQGLIQSENELLAGDNKPAALVNYEPATEYIVLTNISQASGKMLVEELYPLSKEMIKIEP